jgi:hypothetical protein
MRCGTVRGDFYTEIAEGTEFTKRAVTLGRAVKKSSSRRNERAAEGCRSSVPTIELLGGEKGSPESAVMCSREIGFLHGGRRNE